LERRFTAQAEIVEIGLIDQFAEIGFMDRR